MKKYNIHELKIEIEAKDDADFEIKKERLLNRNTRFRTGGNKANKQQALIKEF